jgi:hypothetical protein
LDLIIVPHVQLTPRWYEHWTSNLVYDGDMIVLQGQEKGFLSYGGDVNAEYGKLTFTPTQADRFVLAFRNWLKRHGKGGPEWFPEAKVGQPPPSTVLSKRQVSLLSRLALHCCLFLSMIMKWLDGVYIVFDVENISWIADAGPVGSAHADMFLL